MTIEEHFVEALRAHKRVSRQEALLRTEAVLTSMRVPESRIQNYPHEFSGGMRQRIMIALALVLNPSLLVADEPTTSLDVIVEAQILGILEDLKRTYKMSLLLITHNLGIVAEVCDRRLWRLDQWTTFSTDPSTRTRGSCCSRSFIWRRKSYTLSTVCRLT
jgi:peptide/nickel transport system ATP-binding protein